MITATVTENGQPVPNGTAVEFQTNFGLFTDVEAQSTIRTTTNGIATVTLTSGTVGTATVTAAVNNVSRQTTVTFRSRPTTDPPPSTAPTITSVNPSVGRPAGGEVVRIVGTNFRAPVRVLFNTGGATPKEAFVVSVSPTVIEVITPGVDLGVGQNLESQVTVITEAGTANEQRAQSTFTFRAEVLTPRIITASPASGPIDGGTRITIFGDGFQAPVQVFFGAAEARVIDVRFDQIIVQAPPGRETNPDGSGTVVGPIPVTVVNINSNTRVTADDLFRYVNKMQITAVRPNVGSALGGTDIIIDGIGFDDPAEVIIGGVRAQVLRVSGTQILARTGAAPSSCAGGAFNIFVTNVANGDNDEYGNAPNESAFVYIGVPVQITNVSGTAVPGGSITVTVQDPGIGPLGSGVIRFDVNGRTIIPNPSTVTVGTGPQSFNVPLPTTGFVFPTVACEVSPGVPGTRLGPAEVPLAFNNATTGCTDVVTLTVNPAGPNACVQAPPQAAVTAPSSGCADAGSVSVTDPATGTTTITFRNSAPVGAQNLVIGANPARSGSAEFTITPTTQRTVPPGTTASYTVTFNPTGGAGTRNATFTFTTNDPSQPLVEVCVTGTATTP
ncbi:MAG TPA: IPT/TIG domain-containing protein [Thermoanaerobaculia bacterium]